MHRHLIVYVIVDETAWFLFLSLFIFVRMCIVFIPKPIGKPCSMEYNTEMRAQANNVNSHTRAQSETSVKLSFHTRMIQPHTQTHIYMTHAYDASAGVMYECK